MKPSTIIFVRHGQSAANVDHLVHSHTPNHKIPLTPEGVLQAKQAGQGIAREFAGAPFAVYVSPFLRTRQTWEAISSVFPSTQVVRFREDPRLREQEWGNYQDMEKADAISDERDAFGTFFYRFPMGESGADVYDRCTQFLDTLYRDFDKLDFPQHVLIVSHGFTIRTLLMRWLHWTVEEFENLANPRNCQTFKLQLGPTGHYQLAEPFPKRSAEVIP